MVKSAQDVASHDATAALNGSAIWGIFLQAEMRAFTERLTSDFLALDRKYAVGKFQVDVPFVHAGELGGDRLPTRGESLCRQAPCLAREEVSREGFALCLGPAQSCFNMMRRETKMSRHGLHRIMSRIGIHLPLLASLGLILDPRRFDQPEWHGYLVPR